MQLGLVLSGGGAHGAFQAGVAEAVEEAGLQPSVLSGTSAGAINAAALAAGVPPGELSDLWRGLRARDVYRLRRDVQRLFRPHNLLRGDGPLPTRLLDVIGWTHLYDTAPLRRTLTRGLGSERVRVREGTALVVTAVDLGSEDIARFCNVLPPPARVDPRYRQVELDVDHLLASAAIPLLFRPGTVRGRQYVDGALLANTPLAPALHYEPDAVVIVTTSLESRQQAPPPDTLGDLAERLLDALIGGSLRADLAHARTINELCERDPDDPRKRIELLLVEPVGVDLGGSLDFSPTLANRRIAAGRELATAVLEAWPMLPVARSDH